MGEDPIAGGGSVSQVKVRLLTMSGEAEAALGLAVEALLERDRAKARQVIAGDGVIDAMEMEIEEMCINLLALQQPMARDLRMLTSALKIASDLERLKVCLEGLAPDRRDIVRLAYLDGLSREELGVRFGHPPGTIKTWLHRSLKQLKACLTS